MQRPVSDRSIGYSLETCMNECTTANMVDGPRVAIPSTWDGRGRVGSVLQEALPTRRVRSIASVSSSIASVSETLRRPFVSLLSFFLGRTFSIFPWRLSRILKPLYVHPSLVGPFSLRLRLCSADPPGLSISSRLISGERGPYQTCFFHASTREKGKRLERKQRSMPAPPTPTRDSK